MIALAQDTPGPALPLTKAYEHLLIAYLLLSLFLYQYGIPLGELSLRFPDLVAVPCILLGLIQVTYRPQLTRSARCFWPVLPIVSAEILLPMLGAVAAGGGLGGVENSLRMLFLWAPLMLYVVATPVPNNSFHAAIRTALVITVLANLGYGLIQLLAKIGIVPQALLITAYLEPLALTTDFQAGIQGFRAAGFFINSTALAVFGICGLAYFLGAHFRTHRPLDMVMALLSAVLVLISLSRTGLVALGMILVSYLFFVGPRQALRFLVQGSILTAAIMLLVDRYIGLEIFLSRIDIFLRLGAVGALQDYSFQTRLYDTWPSTLTALHAYPFGTLVSAPAALGLIDSGYLTFYAQGKWLMVGAFSLLLVALFLGGFQSFVTRSNGFRLSAFFLGVFLLGAMVISNPMRNTILVFMLTYFLWGAYQEREAITIVK